MKRITVTAFILIFAFWAACSGGAEPEPPYWNGIDFGPNLSYGEEYVIKADTGSIFNAAEIASLTFDILKASGNIPEYSDDKQYTMTLVDLKDIEGEECYVYRLDGGSGLTGAAHAHQSGNTYMQIGGKWIKPKGPHHTLYAYFSADQTKTTEIPFPEDSDTEEPASIYPAAAFFLADSLSEWTGLDFTLNDVTFGEDSVIVDWSAKSTLIAGLDGREQKKEFHFFDAVSLNWFMMDSLALTLKNNLPVTTVYYCSDGKPVTFPNPEDMAAEGLPELPVDQSYEGSDFFKAHAGGRGDR